jgi:hypothetical protein
MTFEQFSQAATAGVLAVYPGGHVTTNGQDGWWEVTVQPGGRGTSPKHSLAVVPLDCEDVAALEREIRTAAERHRDRAGRAA